MKTIYVSSSRGWGIGGIYSYDLDEKGKLLFKEKTEAWSPTYFAKANGKLFALLRDPYKAASPNSALVSFDILEDGHLANKSEMVSTEGTVACHLSVSQDGKDVYAANYSSGSVSKVGEKLVVHEGKGPHPSRQTAPHTHIAILTPDEKYVVVCDLGIDKIFFYDRNLEVVSITEMPAGSGPRHIAFSNDGKLIYCVTELSNEVIVLKYEDGKAEIVSEGVSTLPEDYKGGNTASAIRLSKDGKYLYVANRGHNSIVAFSVDEEKVSEPEFSSCGGKTPRDIYIVDDILLCANQDTDTVMTFKVNGKNIEPTGYFVCVEEPMSIID